MAMSLYDASITNYLQFLSALDGILAKGLAHCKEKSISPEELVEARLYPDMQHLRFQIQLVSHHCVHAIEAIKGGVFYPPRDLAAPDYAGLQKMIVDARTAMEKETPAAINAREGKDVLLDFGERKLPFTAEGFLQSMSLPNFYFHATTAYDILRMKGVPLGKRDFMGAMRMKQ